MFNRDLEKTIELTREKYSQLTGKKVSYDEAVDIVDSLREYSSVLLEIYEENKELFHLKTGIPFEEEKTYAETI